MSNYTIFDHTADIGIEVTGRTRKELFSNALEAMFDVMVEKQIGSKKMSLVKRKIEIAGSDLEDTMINFLREALYLFNGEGWLVRKCEFLEVTKTNVVVKLQGEPYNNQIKSLKTEIKAVTYHGLIINRTNKGWKAKVIFDV